MDILKVQLIHYSLKYNTNVKKDLFGQNKWYKKVLSFFLLRAATHHGFTFNFKFVYELKNKVRLSKTMCRIFRLWFCFDFIKVYIFVQENTRTIWLYKIAVPFKIHTTEKSYTGLGLWLFSYNKKFENSMKSALVGAPLKPTWWQMFYS